jgi:hypothetical protein
MKKLHFLLPLLLVTGRLAAQTAPLSFLFENVNGTPTHVAVAPSLDLPLVAVALEKGERLQFFTPDGQRLGTAAYPSDRHPVSDLRWSPDGRWLAVSSQKDEKIYLYNRRGEQTAEWSTPAKWQAWGGFSGTLVTCRQSGRVRFLNPEAPHFWMDFDCGERFFTDARTGSVRSVRASSDHIPANASCFTMSPDGALALTGYPDGRVHLVQVSGSGTPQRTFKTGLQNIENVLFTLDGKQVLALGNAGKTLWVQSLESGAQPQTIALSQAVGGLLLSPDGQRLLPSRGVSQQVPVWDLRSGQVLRQVPIAAPLHAAALSPDGRWVLLGLQNGQLQLVALDSSLTREALRPAYQPVFGPAAAPEGTATLALPLVLNLETALQFGNDTNSPAAVVARFLAARLRGDIVWKSAVDPNATNLNFWLTEVQPVRAELLEETPLGADLARVQVVFSLRQLSDGALGAGPQTGFFGCQKVDGRWWVVECPK